MRKSTMSAKTEKTNKIKQNFFHVLSTDEIRDDGQRQRAIQFTILVFED